MLLGAHIYLYVTAGFFGENPYQAKMTKNGQKWHKNRVFGLCKKIRSLVLSRICVKWKFLWFINVLQKLHTWEKYGSQWLLANKISLFFNCQYFTNRLISHFEFWHVDSMNERNKVQVNRFSEKILIWANGPFWAQKLHILITQDLVEGFFFLILHNERG